MLETRLPDMHRIVGSHDVVIDGVVVPEEWTFVRGGASNLDEPMFRYPSLSFATQVLSVVGLGVARAALDLGFYISFSGILTFKNAVELQEVARCVPLDRCLIETDSPYLAPVPRKAGPLLTGLDPVAALGVMLRVPPGAQASVTFATAAATHFFRCLSYQLTGRSFDPCASRCHQCNTTENYGGGGVTSLQRFLEIRDHRFCDASKIQEVVPAL